MPALLVIVAVLGGIAAVPYFYYRRRFLNLLKEYPGFSAKFGQEQTDVKFYQSGLDDPNLISLREKYDLDSVAGSGSEPERIINLMRWVHQLTKHSHNPSIPDQRNALNLIHLCQTENKKLNCWLYATILNDVYLSMGFASRIIHLYPRKQNPKESHVINAVYSNDLNKWVFMDPDMRGYFMDEQGQLLGVQEIRQRMISGDPLIVSDDIVPWARRLGKNFYKWYISKNIFRYDCPQYSVFDYESQASGRVYIQLIPDGYHEDWLLEPRITERGNTIVYINDAARFWQASSTLCE